MKAFTPGPWTFMPTTSRANHASVIGAKNGDGFTPWVCHMQSADIELSNANARLIAAAPDLLAALVEMVAQDGEAIKDAKAFGIPFPPEMLATYNAARAAIAKATGDAP